jgi:hypothetical protein
VMHDGHHVDPRPDRGYAVEATRLLVPAVKARGLTFGRLCDAVEHLPELDVIENG